MDLLFLHEYIISVFKELSKQTKIFSLSNKNKNNKNEKFRPTKQTERARRTLARVFGKLFQRENEKRNAVEEKITFTQNLNQLLINLTLIR
jgi:hypothetical protein